MTVAKGVTPARACAFRVVRRVFEQGAYADRALNGEAEGLDPRERSLATALAYGTVQRRATLDHIAAELSSRPLKRLDPPALAAIRLGLYQLLFLGGVADHAAVNESVELAKAGGGAGLVNAVLRRATAEAPAILAAMDDRTPEAAAILHSVPGWLASQWFAELGAEEARSLLAAINEPAESAIRVNTLVATADSVIDRLTVPAHAAPELPEALILDGPFDLQSSELWAQGAVMAQSRASMRVARMLEPASGDRVLDLCAAPGGKTTHIAALMDDRGEVEAVERHPGRADALRRTAERMHATCVLVLTRDAAEPAADGPYDRVLVDPPCSGLGTLQSRPDLRWRTSPERIAELAGLQARILAAGAAATAPAGTLVYAVCTISRAEGEGVVDGFLAAHPEFELDARLQLLPHRDGSDGFFVARFRR